MQSIRISYGQSSIMRCSIALSYDRFFTDFTSHQSGVPVETGDLINKSDDINKIFSDDNKERNLSDDFKNVSGWEHMPLNFPGNPNAGYQFNGIQF